MKIIWSEQARKDLRAIWEYIARDSRFYADRTVEKIATRAGELRAQPKRGHHVHEYPELESSLRETHESSYRIIYSLAVPGEIAVVTVIHFSRQFKLTP